MNLDDFFNQPFQHQQQSLQRSFQQSQQAQQQIFERIENDKLRASLQSQTEELVRTLHDYNELVEQFYNETKKQNEENAKEMKRLERSKKRLTIVSIVIAALGVIASALIGIFF